MLFCSHPFNTLLTICLKVEPYWLEKTPNFWDMFIRQYERYDHVYLIDIFKLICGDVGYRRLIFQHFLRRDRLLTNNYSSCSERKSLNEVLKSWNTALKTKVDF